MTATALEGGFAHPAHDAAYAFRALMEAMARPGRIEQVTGATPPAPLSPAAGVALLTLCDPDTPVYLAAPYDTQDIRDWVSFHTGAPLSGATECMFAVGRWEDLLPLSQFKIGTAEYPDRSATLIVERAALAAEGSILSGPGILDTARLTLPDPDALRANAGQFPLGLDFFFSCGDRIAALPRTTRVG